MSFVAVGLAGIVLAFLFNGINHVIAAVSKPKMCRIDALGNIACV
jgi:hypothetical protein